MDDMTASEVAQRAAVPSGFVERLVELGIIAPREDGRYSAGDLHRARLMHSCGQAGLPLEVRAYRAAPGSDRARKERR